MEAENRWKPVNPGLPGTQPLKWCVCVFVSCQLFTSSLLLVTPPFDIHRNIMQIVLVLTQKCWSSPKALIGRACADWLRRNAAVTPAVPVAAAKLAARFLGRRYRNTLQPR